MSWHFVSKDRHELVRLYADWRTFNRPVSAKTINLIAVASMAALIPFDYLFFGRQGLVYSPYRVVSIVTLVLALLALSKLDAVSSKYRETFASVILLYPTLLYNFLYAHFLVITAAPHHMVVLTANLMVIFFTTFYLHRFWREQYILNLVSIAVLACMAIFEERFRTDALLLIWCHVASFVGMYFFRRQFAGSLYERFKDVRSLLPAHMAKFISVAQGSESIHEIFKAKNRFAVCLVADWREYQNLAEQIDAGTISVLFERFYNHVFAELENTVPEGTYYADWTADELFVVFFNDDDDPAIIIKQALRFAKRLATEVVMAVRKDSDYELVFDIGMACGVGLLGLQGPSKRKKTTITAKFAGTAKRLETEAKTLRRAEGMTNTNPLVAMDETLMRTAVTSGLFQTSETSEFVAKTKNISGQAFYLWQKESGPDAITADASDAQKSG